MHWRYRLRKQQLLDECHVPPELSLTVPSNASSSSPGRSSSAWSVGSSATTPAPTWRA
jgi:hypothetical protein